MKLLSLRKWVGNPLIEPRLGYFWESGGTFNPAAFTLGDKVYLMYRQVSRNCVSTLGLAVIREGCEVVERLDSPIYIPREEFELYPTVANRFSSLELVDTSYIESNLVRQSGGSCFGVEDPRVTVFEDKIYLTYVAYNGVNPPRGAMSWIYLQDFLNHRWDRWSRPILITHPSITDKSIVMLPKKTRGKWVFLHRIFPHIWVDEVSDLSEFKHGRYLWGRPAIRTRPKYWDSRKIGAGALVEWQSKFILVYYGVSGWDDYYYTEGFLPSDFTASDGYKYKVGLMVLDSEEPTKVLYRSDNPIGEPELWYEVYPKAKPNVMYPTGAVVLDGKLFIYYGASDYFVAVGELSMDELENAISTALVG
ncbi:MAG: hypothetical protein RMI56_03230 [Sulfolobales archaeon]|nr:hypothetical protein [Sulfolobales archaeon]MDW8082793.1 hypothetical protein [Sulfolobales archaeon]